MEKMHCWHVCSVKLDGGGKVGEGGGRIRIRNLEKSSLSVVSPRFTICPSFLTVVYFVSCDWGTGFHRLSPLECISKTRCHRFFFVCLSIKGPTNRVIN